MRLKIQGKDVEVRVQERRIVVADFIYKGKVVASGVATQAPVDAFDLEAGEKLAVTRAAQQMYQVEVAADKQARENVENALRANSVISATIELPRMAMVHEMYAAIMDRLAKRRARRAAEKAKADATLTVKKLADLVKEKGTGRLSFPSLLGLPFFTSGYLRDSAYLIDRGAYAKMAAAEPETPTSAPGPSCRDLCQGYVCTRVKGHSGDHIAHDSWNAALARQLQRWPQSPRVK